MTPKRGKSTDHDRNLISFAGGPDTSECRITGLSLHNFIQFHWHYSDVIMSSRAIQMAGASIVCSTICLGADQRKHQGSLSLSFVRGIYRWPMNSPHKRAVTRKCFHLLTSSYGTQRSVIEWYSGALLHLNLTASKHPDILRQDDLLHWWILPAIGWKI